MMMGSFLNRVYFAHFRNTVLDANPENFPESGFPLCSPADMVCAMQCLLDEKGRRKAAGWPDWHIPVCSDHRKLMDIDLGKHCYAGVFLRWPRDWLGGAARSGNGPPSFRSLAGKTTVETGAAGVACSVMARDLLKAGACMALLGRTRFKLEDLQRKLAEEGLNRMLVLVADVLDKAALEQPFSHVKEAWGRLDILMNGAGDNNPRGTSPAEQIGSLLFQTAVGFILSWFAAQGNAFQGYEIIFGSVYLAAFIIFRLDRSQHQYGGSRGKIISQAFPFQRIDTVPRKAELSPGRPGMHPTVSCGVMTA